MKIYSTKLLAFVCFIATILSCSSQKNTDLPSLKNQKVLLVYGGWDGHQPKVYAQKINEWLQKEGAIVTMSDSLGVYTQEKIMDNTDIIIQHWTMGKITEKQSKALIKAVKGGVNIGGCHGGLGDSFRGNVEYQDMIGGQFLKHPGAIIDFEINVKDPNNPITKGLTKFTVKQTEQYYMLVDPRVNVLATTTFSDKYEKWINGVVMPSAWTTNYGKGKVFFTAIGHNPTDLDAPEVWQIYSNGIRSLAR